MKGDFTRFTHDPEKHYSGVLQQQGRVSVDADWNEHVAIQDHLRITGTKDIIGRCGVPYSTKDGFLVDYSSDNSQLVLKSGDVKPARIYVDGIMCEIEKDVLLPNPKDNGTYLAYIDVWQRHITAVEDSEIVEVALGGPDTTTRIKTDWQIRLKEISAEIKNKTIDLKKFCCGRYAWSPVEYASTGEMAAQSEQPSAEESLCEPGARGGYRGLENRLYRVEIHGGGNLDSTSVTFKWSRDNGSVVFPIEKIEYKGGKSTITLKQTGKDALLTLHVGDWIEISADNDELNLKTGVPAQVAQGSDMSQGIVVLETDVSAYQNQPHPKIRRWDQKDTSEISLTGGVIKITADTWIPLEDGVQVSFHPGTYQTGDYWLVPARTRLRDVLWDIVGGNPVYESRHGTEHYYCALAVVEYNGKLWTEPADLRHIFYPLNELKKACCIPVHPGENIQRVIDCVIASGGGCICLCGGVHHVHGPLILERTQNLTICGENTATIVHFEGSNQDGEGGFVLKGCSQIIISDMLVIGDDVSALFTLKGSEESRNNINITLENIAMFNRTVTKKDEPGSKCAVRLGQVGDVNIVGCRMLAENGIITLLSDALPVPSILDNLETLSKFTLYLSKRDVKDSASMEMESGLGVNQLCIKDTAIFYQNYGIWALKGIRWEIENCRIAALEIREKLQDDKTSKLSYMAILSYIESLSFARPVTRTGTAIKALIWQDCQVKSSSLSGSTGLNISCWCGGEAVNNSFTARRGLITLWLHNGVLRNNNFKSGICGMAFSGSYRSRIEGNRVRGGTGLANAPLNQWLGGFKNYLSEVIRAYNVHTDDAAESYELIVLWLLLEEAVTGLGLSELRDAVQELLDTFENFRGIPVLLLVAAYLYPHLGNLAETAGQIPMPIISLTVVGNEFEAKTGIELADFIPMAGINISGNRVQTLRGQAIEIKANPYTVNPNVTIFAWRYLYRTLSSILPLLSQAMLGEQMKDLTDDRKKAVAKILSALEKIFSNLNNIIEPILEADYRIENNSIRSQRTAITTNIFEMAIQNNHITMEESGYSNKEGADIIKILDKHDATKDLAMGMSQGSSARMRILVHEESNTALSGNTLTDFTEAASELREVTASTDLKNASDGLLEATLSGDRKMLVEALGTIVDVLEPYVDTCGIWTKGAGCRIVGNQILVPPDAAPDTWAQGGIRFWDDEGSPIWFIALLEELLNAYTPNARIPSLLGATETLIADNEILRGVGHGIDIRGIANMPYGMGLIDIEIRGNQVLDMAGAGIAFDEKSLTIGADIEDNRILDCGRRVEASFSGTRGGIVVRNAAVCRILGNRIRCSSDLSKDNGLFAIDLLKINGLTMTDNHLQHAEVSGYKFEMGTATFGKLLSNSNLSTLALANMCGIVRVSEISGEITIHDNEILLARGVGAGLVMGDIDAAALEFWEQPLKNFAEAKNIGLTENVTTETTNIVVEPIVRPTSSSVQANHFESLMGSQFFTFLITGLQDLNFSNNNVRAKTTSFAPGYILDIIRGVINNNMLDTLTITMASGVLAGNVSNAAISIPPGVTSGLNSP